VDGEERTNRLFALRFNKTRRAWFDCLEARKRQGVGSGDPLVYQILASLEAREDFLKHIEQECDRDILRVAMQLVEGRVQPHVWQAFLMTAMEGRTGQDVAGELKMTVVAVYRARSRVQAMLRDQVSQLDLDEVSGVTPVT